MSTFVVERGRKCLTSLGFEKVYTVGNRFVVGIQSTSLAAIGDACAETDQKGKLLTVIQITCDSGQHMDELPRNREEDGAAFHAASRKPQKDSERFRLRENNDIGASISAGKATRNSKDSNKNSNHDPKVLKYQRDFVAKITGSIKDRENLQVCSLIIPENRIRFVSMEDAELYVHGYIRKVMHKRTKGKSPKIESPEKEAGADAKFTEKGEPGSNSGSISASKHKRKSGYHVVREYTNQNRITTRDRNTLPKDDLHSRLSLFKKQFLSFEEQLSFRDMSILLESLVRHDSVGMSMVRQRNKSNNTVGNSSEKHLLTNIVSELLFSFQCCGPQELTHMVWSIAKIDAENPQKIFFRIASKKILEEMDLNPHQWKPRHLSNILYAYGKILQPQFKLFEKCIELLLEKTKENEPTINSQDWCNGIYGLSKSVYRHNDFMLACQRFQVETIMGDTRVLTEKDWQHLSLTCYSICNLAKEDDEFFAYERGDRNVTATDYILPEYWEKVGEEMGRLGIHRGENSPLDENGRLTLISQRSMIMTIHAFATVNFFHEGLGKVLEKINTHTLVPQDVSMLLWSIAKNAVTPSNHWLFSIITHARSLGFSNFTPSQMSNMIWGVSVVLQCSGSVKKDQNKTTSGASQDENETINSQLILSHLRSHLLPEFANIVSFREKEWTTADLSMLYCADGNYRNLGSQIPSLFSTSTSFRSLQRKAQRSWKTTESLTVSDLQKKIMEQLRNRYDVRKYAIIPEVRNLIPDTHMGCDLGIVEYASANDENIEGKPFSKRRNMHLLIEVDGPSHYVYDLGERRYRMDGPTLVKKTILENYGYKVVNIKWNDKMEDFEWW